MPKIEWLGQVDRAQADVGPAVEGALGSQGKVSVSRRWARAWSPATSRARAVMVPVSARVPGVGDPVEVALVEDDEAAGGVEDVGDGGIL